MFSLGFMLHLSSHFSVTKFATDRHPDIKGMCKTCIGRVMIILMEVYTGQKPLFWDNVQGHFLDHLEEINELLVASGRPKLGGGAPVI